MFDIRLHDLGVELLMELDSPGIAADPERLVDARVFVASRTAPFGNRRTDWVWLP
jgi:hypothetical protein